MKHSLIAEQAPLMGKPFFRWLLTSLLLLVIVLDALTYFDSVYEEAMVQKHELEKDMLRSSLDFMHRQWMINAKYPQVRIDFVVEPEQTESINVVMNAQGWPININHSKRELDCRQLWRYLGRNHITESHVVQLNSECSFRVLEADGSWVHYQYWPKTGDVKIKLVSI